MMNTAPLSQLVDELPQRSITTMVLGALDFVVPGQWQNVTGFTPLVKHITGETRIGKIDAISTYADQLYQGDLSGCQKAIWLYQTADSSDSLLSAAALAHQVGEKIGFLNFLSKVTPKDETLQCVDLAVKLTVEALAYLMIHGFKHEEAHKFSESLESVSNENAMRMAALVCIDGLLPLGPEFVTKVNQTLGSLSMSSLESHPIFSKVGHLLPGGDKLGFIRSIFERSQGWMTQLQSVQNLTPSSLMGRLQGVVDFSEDKLDFLAAFLDATTNYVSHTGTQSVARHVISKSAERFIPKVNV